MPFIDIYSKEEIDSVNTFEDKLTRAASACLNCEESFVPAKDFNIYPHVLKHARLRGNIDIRIIAHNFPSRIGKEDQMSAEIEEAMNNSSRWKNVKVYVVLAAIGVNLMS